MARGEWREVLLRYKGQEAVERRYSHLKGPLAVASLFLKNNGSDTVRIDSDGMITDRWSGLTFAHLHWQLEQNATL